MRFPTRLVAACLACVQYACPALATFWTVTSYLELDSTTRSHSSGDASDDFFNVRTVRTGVVPSAVPLSTSTRVNSYEQVTIVYVYLPPDSVPDSDIQATTDRTPSVPTVFVEPVVYTAPASCPTPFTVSTYTEVSVPSAVTARVSPTSVTTRTMSVGSGRYTFVTAFLAPGAAPLPTYTADYVYTYYVASCRNPTATGAAYYGPSYGVAAAAPSSAAAAADYRTCSLWAGGCPMLHAWVLAVAVALPTIFVLGFVESFFWFRQLMLGRAALRFGTVCWIAITLWILCFTKTSPPRSLEDQKALRIQWDGLSAATKWTLWWRWGFRHAYPEQLLGPDPSYTYFVTTQVLAVERGQEHPGGQHSGDDEQMRAKGGV